MKEALSNALAAIDRYCGDDLDDSKALVRAKCRALMVGYDARWLDAGYRSLTVEKIYTSPLWNPATNARSRSFSVAGKLDVYATLNGRNYVIDHKTTSDDICDPDAPYWRQLVVEGQVTHYMLLQWLHGEKPDGAVWDVIRKPGISPKELTQAARRLCVADRKYFNRTMSGETLAALQTSKRETLEMYEARLAHDCTIERPDRYFQRRPVPRLDQDILEYAEDLWQHSQNMLAARRQSRLPKNSGACMLYGSPCKFLGICSGHDSIDSDRWRRREIRHTELAEAGKMNAITNSRVRCFQTCPVKHHYEYELCLERQDEEEKEALYFGSAFHEGLRVWWEAFLLEANHGDSEQESPAIAVGNGFAETELSARDTHGR